MAKDWMQWWQRERWERVKRAAGHAAALDDLFAELEGFAAEARERRRDDHWRTRLPAGDPLTLLAAAVRLLMLQTDESLDEALRGYTTWLMRRHIWEVRKRRPGGSRKTRLRAG